jgi:LDH2 family malate/lactate/ureidoglycolate dehydrogenase
VHSPYKTADKSNCGHLIVVIDIERLQPLAQFNLRMEEYIVEIKSVPPAQGFDEVFYPGEIEARNDKRNRAEGLLFPEDTLSDLRRIARETNLEAKLPF